MKPNKTIVLTALSAMLLFVGCAAPNGGLHSGSGAVPDGYYRVRAGDNLYRIGLRFGQSVNTLSAWNNIADPSYIKVGQVLRVRANAGSPPPARRNAAAPVRAATTPPPAATQPPRSTQRTARLQWPLRGEIIEYFNGGTNRGIGIAVAEGTPVKAAADGVVSYAGEGIQGYGKLIFITHRNGLSTIYAHNRSLRVREGQEVRAGEQIAESGSTGNTDRPKLYFEVRQRQGSQNPRPLNPLEYLGN